MGNQFENNEDVNQKPASDNHGEMPDQDYTNFDTIRMLIIISEQLLQLLDTANAIFAAVNGNNSLLLSLVVGDNRSAVADNPRLPEEPILRNAAYAADRLSVCERTLRRIVARGDLNVYEKRGRNSYFKDEDVERAYLKYRGI